MLLFRPCALTPIQLATFICRWSALLFIPDYVLLGLSHLGLATGMEVGIQALYRGVLMSGVAVVTFNRSMALLGPEAAFAIIALWRAVASLLAVPVLTEVPTTATRCLSRSSTSVC